MAQVVIDATTGTGSSPWRANFPTNEDVDQVYGFAFVGFTRQPISEEYARALKDTLEGYCNDSARGLQCTTTTFATNLAKPETGAGFVQVEIHTGATLTDEESASASE